MKLKWTRLIALAGITLVTTTLAQASTIEHVLLISVDGLHALD